MTNISKRILALCFLLMAVSPACNDSNTPKNTQGQTTVSPTPTSVDTGSLTSSSVSQSTQSLVSVPSTQTDTTANQVTANTSQASSSSAQLSGVGFVAPAPPAVITVQAAIPPVSDAFFAERTGVVNSINWTTIPGLSVTFTLKRPANVVVLADGHYRPFPGGCLVSLRTTVDGNPRGDAYWGQRLKRSNASSEHENWTLQSGETLAAGSHTISIDARNENQNGCKIMFCGEWNGSINGYTSCNVSIVAHYIQ